MVLIPAIHAAADILEVVECGPTQWAAARSPSGISEPRTPSASSPATGFHWGVRESESRAGQHQRHRSRHQSGGHAGFRTATTQYIFSPALPNEYFSSVPYDQGLTGAWTLTITNPTSANSPLATQTPAVGFERGPAPTRPSFTWTLPPAGSFTSAAIINFDLDDRTPTGAARLVHTVANLPLATTSYEVQATLSGGSPSARHELRRRHPARRAPAERIAAEPIALDRHAGNCVRLDHQHRYGRCGRAGSSRRRRRFVSRTPPPRLRRSPVHFDVRTVLDLHDRVVSGAW